MNATDLTPHEQTYETRATLLGALDAFTTGYLECALWSSTEELEDGNGGPPLDENHGLDDIDLESLESAIGDCAAFQAENARDLLRAYNSGRGAGQSYDAGMAGHDFWLTRNGHGAGFWDHGFGPLGDRLSKASKAYGSIDLMAWEGVVSGH